MNGEEMPEGLPQEDQMAWQAVSHLYGRFRLKIIDRTTGGKEKGQIAYAYHQAKSAAEWGGKLAKWHSGLMKAIEGAANAYAKNRTLGNADRLYEAVYGMLPKGIDFCHDNEAENVTQ